MSLESLPGTASNASPRVVESTQRPSSSQSAVVVVDRACDVDRQSPVVLMRSVLVAEALEGSDAATLATSENISSAVRSRWGGNGAPDAIEVLRRMELGEQERIAIVALCACAKNELAVHTEW